MSKTPPNPVAIVTGAGSGIGAETVRGLIHQSWNVVLAGRNESTLQSTAESTGTPDACLIAPTDLAKPEQITDLVSRTLNAFGRIDALINNAGAASLVPIELQNNDTLRESFAVNTIGPGLLIAATFPVMQRQSSGRIINVATKGITDPFPGFFAYAAAKAALDSFTRSIQNEGAEHNILAFTVAPGAVETPMLRALFSTDILPENATLAPATVADLIIECTTGKRDPEAGQTIYLEAN